MPHCSTLDAWTLPTARPDAGQEEDKGQETEGCSRLCHASGHRDDDAMRRLVLMGLLATTLAVPTVQHVAAAAPRCDVTPTSGLEIHSPYADTSALQGSGDGAFPRTYELFVPPGLPRGPVPLLISIHGLLGNAVQQAGQTDWAHYFTTVSPTPVIVAWPNGPERWDTRPASEDVQFIRDVVADIRADRCVDPRRIYAVGHSYGAFMVQRLVCDSGDLFAAGASYAGGDIEGSAVGGPCNAGTGAAGAPPDPPGYLPAPLGMWHGTADSIVSYKDELRSQTKWLQRYDCDTTPVATTPAGSGVDTGGIATGYLYGRCARPDVARLDGPPLLFQALPDHNHGWPNGCVGSPGADGAGAESCSPDGTYPTADGFDATIWSWLSRWTRARPAADQSVSLLTPPSAYGPTPGLTTGADNTAQATIQPAAEPSGSVLDLTPDSAGLVHVGVRIDVTTNSNGQGLGADYPLCPQSSDGSTTQPAVGKTLTVSLGDGSGRAGTSTQTTATTVADGDGARVDVALAVPARVHGQLAIRATYPGDPSSTWETCGVPIVFAKQTIEIER